ncbi:MAG: alpha-L-arabinofuranosidase C-terminal domain-containing protein [Candidatus Omnitrophica bacterium]|nr:alpha-L-arabinofuranosidase C-terminal domain-containing protein [Candidatus Omnitrophota bacterium]MDD5552961.1 alpha-L-arabinofuranosidase C-terminal domain-containing protein [Candidatus Omnitrophota bacterium]
MKLKISVFALFIIFSFSLCFAEEAIIIFDQEKGPVNKNIFGVNLTGYDPGSYKRMKTGYAGHSNFGSGIWDPDAKAPAREAMSLIRKAGATVLRFPGGCGAHHYNWKDTIDKKRNSFLYGLNEFLFTCKELNAVTVITLSEFEGDENDVRNLARYVKSYFKGYSAQPIFFEVGNETWHGDHRFIRSVSPAWYAQKYLRYYNAVKSAEPDIQVGVVLGEDKWNNRVLSLIKEKCDFGSLHFYAKCWLDNKEIRAAAPEEAFRETFIVLAAKQKRLNQVSGQLERSAGRKIPLAVTEFNSLFPGHKSIPFRHTLGSALLNAELISFFLNPQNNVSFSTYWQYCNSYMGMVANGFDGTAKTLLNKYYKRPNFYVFNLYKEHFGQILLKSEVSSSDGFASKKGLVHYLSVTASKDKKNKKIYLMVINKRMDKPVTANIYLKNFPNKNKCDAWVLNGPGIEATNEMDHDNVKVTRKRLRIDGSPFTFTFEPHSVTAIEIRKE